jgi:tetratricopeptide (TPR) repeat protein
VPILATLLPAARGQASNLEAAEQLYRKTGYQAALQMLAKQSESPAALFLAGRCWYHKGDFKKAVEVLEKAVRSSPRNATYHNWLGKAWGRRAEHANMLQAPGFATRARDAFEKAVALDPSHAEALTDLFQYYLEAPGFLGGGLDKASGLLPRIEQADPSAHHASLAMIAEKQKDFGTAEAHFRRAMAAAPKLAGKVVDLARFLSRRGRHKECDAVLADAAQRWPGNPGVVFAQAEVLVETKRNPEQARKLLQRYSSLPLTPDDPPREEAVELLKRVGG